MIVSGIDIDIKRSKRKTVSIFVERDGSVSARVPEDLPDERIAEVIESKAYKIHTHLAQWNELNDAKIEREYVSGQSFLYLGKNYRLKLIDEPTKGLKLKKGFFLLHNSHQAKAKAFFEDFYRTKLREKLPQLIDRHKNKLGVSPVEVKVMELQNRWASCTQMGNLNFHWKCAMAPIDVLNYIVVHELAHLIHPNHTTAFWNEVDKVLPNYESQLQWLKRHGAGMDL